MINNKVKDLTSVIVDTSAAINSEKRFSNETLQLVSETTQARVSDMASQSTSLLPSEADVDGSIVSNKKNEQTVNPEYQIERLYPQEYFPSTGQRSQNVVGQYSGSIIGQNEFYAPGAVRYPVSISDRRKRNLAQAEEKAEKRRSDYLLNMTVAAAAQYQGQMDDMEFEALEDYMSKFDGSPVDAVNDLTKFRSPESIAYWKAKAQRKALGARTIETTTAGKAILENVNTGKMYAPDSVLDSIYQFNSGSMDMQDMYANPEKYKKHEDNIRSFQNLTLVIKDMQPTITSQLAGMAANGSLFNQDVSQEMIDSWKKGPVSDNDEMWLSSIIKGITPEAYDSLADGLKKSGNFAQSKSEIKDYLQGMFGSGQLAMDKAILSNAKPARTNVNVRVDNNPNAIEKEEGIIGMNVNDLFLNGKPTEKWNTTASGIASLPSDATEEDVTEAIKSIVPDAEWTAKNGYMYGRIDVQPDFFDGKDVSVPIQDMIKNNDSRWSFTNGNEGNRQPIQNILTKIAKTERSEDGKMSVSQIPSEMQLQPVNVYYEFSDGTKKKQLSVDQMRSGKIPASSQKIHLVTEYAILVPQPGWTPPLNSNTGDPIAGSEAPLVIDPKAPKLWKSTDATTSFGRQSFENDFNPVQDDEAKSQKSQVKSGGKPSRTGGVPNQTTSKTTW